jgi:peptidyl-prolyl cis-trans isomerase C
MTGCFCARNWNLRLAPLFLRNRLIEGILLLLVAALGSCSEPQVDSSLLAKVGEVQIRASDLRLFEARLEGDAGEQMDHRAHLQTLIDREVLLAEARALGLQDDREVLRRLEEHETQALANAMLRRHVLEQAVVGEEEIKRAYAQAGGDTKVVALEIFVPDAERARQVMDLLQKGTDFAKVGRLFAMDPYFGVLAGGPKRSIYSSFDGPRVVVEAVFALPLGGVSQPIPLHGGFVIATPVEHRRVELAEVADGIRKVLLKEKKKQLRQSYLRHLKWDLGISSHSQGMDLVVAALKEAVAPDSLDEEQRRLPVYTFEGVSMDVGKVLEVVRPSRSKWPQASADAVNQKLVESYFPNTVMAQDARRKGVDQTEVFQRWRRAEMEAFLLGRLRQQVLADGTEPREEDLERFFEENKSRYRTSAWARLQEILVQDPAQAQELAAQIADGAEIGPLASAHSLRRKGKNGVMDVSASQASFYGEAWMNAVMNAPLNQVRGPIQTKGGYSVFEVLERYPESFFTLENEAVRRSVTRDVRQRKERKFFNRYLEELRREAADRIEVYEENLQYLLQEGADAAAAAQI